MLRWKSSLKPTSGGGGADYRSTVLADNPLFYYRLGETSGATALDEVTSSNNGTYYNTPSLGETGAISGDSNTSVLFEQANAEYAKTVTLSSETSLLPCTIECFIKLSGASDSYAGIVFYRASSGSASGLHIKGATLGKLAYNWRDVSNTWNYSGGPTLSDNTWYYVALVVESTKATFYVIEEDGTLTTAVNSVSHSALDCSNDGWLIARDKNVRYFQGYLDEVAIYDQALSQSTLVAHAAAAGYASDGYLIDENFDDNLLPSGWTVTGTYSITGGILEGINGADYVTFDVPSAMQDEFWMYARIDGADGNFSKASYSDMFEVLDSSNAEFIQGQFYGTSAGFYRLDGATTATSQMVSLSGTAYYVWFHFVKNGTSELWISQSSTKPTTDSSTECVISCSTANTSAAKLNLKLGWSNGTRPLKWDFFIGDDAEI